MAEQDEAPTGRADTALFIQRKAGDPSTDLQVMTEPGDEEKGQVQQEREEGEASSDDKAAPTTSSPWLSILLPLLIVGVGIAACTAFIKFGLDSASNEADYDFRNRAGEIANRLRSTVAEYETAALWIQQAGRGGRMTRAQFADLHEFIKLTQLPFQAIGFAMRISHDERAAVEEESRTFLQSVRPEIPYFGIKALVLN